MAPPDLADFAGAGQRLLGGHLDGIYESGWNQAGPLQLLVSRLLMIGGADGKPSAATFFVVNAGLMIAALRLCGGNPRREAITGLLALLWIALPVVGDGHPAELVVPVLWAYAMVLGKSRRRVAAGTVLGVAVAIAPWAVLGFPCLLAAGPLRLVVRVAGLGGIVGVAAYLPFVAGGHFGMFGHVWPVAEGTLAAFAGLDQVTWAVRLVQAVVVAGGCGLVAWRFREKTIVIAGAPAAAVLLRVATDSVELRYYWGPVAVTTVMVLALMPDRRWWPGALLGYLALLAASLGRPLAGATVCLAVLMVTLTGAHG
ncbi:hypothetical protein FB565_003952 [Actinoplanes lutulentus]|nr:hypothetical protein [Actinoplanes lutulentus]MBB2944223.1 hypothetical protein [Actinoplanes lutulentus]